MLSVNINNISIITIKGDDYHCIIHDISKSEAINLSKNSVLKIASTCKMHINIKNQVQYHYENLIEPKKLETRNILIDKKRHKDLVNYFTIYHHDESTTMLNLYYDEKIEERKIEEDERKNP